MRERLGRVPSVGWVCALIALLNAFAWSIITPPLQGKDEVDHFAYVAHLAQKGTLPEGGSGEETEYSPQQLLVMEGIHYYEVRFSPQTPALTSDAQQKTLMEYVAAGRAVENATEGAGIATTEPPLYYALQVIPYELGGSNMLTQVQLMRLLGVLFGAMTALLTFMFLRESLPGVPWAATVGALCVALQPLLAFMSGSVNPDSMLYTVTAAVFYCLARAFRRGLTTRLAIALGLLVAIGFLTKLNFIGFAAGVFAGLAVLAVREAKARGRTALLAPAIAACIGVVPGAIYVLRNVLTSRPTFGSASGVAGTISIGTLFKELSYTWQLFLPRLPGMPHYFVGIMTFKDVWFDRSVGLYGWMDTMFPGWVDNVALVPAAAVALLCARGLYARRLALRARLPEIGVYAAITVGVLVMIGLSSYSSDVIGGEAAFGEPRYLLPMIPLLGAVIALAVRGAGRRWAPVVGAAMVVLFLGHDIFSQLQVIARYYG
jgi:4-amino-4-deoxy-L-arabinose transferase-like glycosyltransferase